MRLVKDAMSGSRLQEHASRYAKEVFSSWERNNSRVSSMYDNNAVLDMKKLALKVLFRLMLGRHELPIEELMAWQKDYEAQLYMYKNSLLPS